MRLKPFLFLCLSITNFAEINASNSETGLFLFFSIVSTTLAIKNYTAINNLQKKQNAIVKQCLESNVNEPDDTIQALNIAKAQYKQAIDLKLPVKLNMRNFSHFCKLPFVVTPWLRDSQDILSQKPIGTDIISNTLVFLNLTASIYDRFKILQDQQRWNEGCKQAETISTQMISEFHDTNDAAIRNTNDAAIRNRQSLAKNNVLIQKENELIDAMNTMIFHGDGINTWKNNSISIYNQLIDLRKMGKTSEQNLKAMEIENKISRQKDSVKCNKKQ